MSMESGGEMSEKAELQREIESIRQAIVVLEKRMGELRLRVARAELGEVADEWESKFRAVRDRGESTDGLWARYLAEIAPYEQRVEELEKNYDY